MTKKLFSQTKLTIIVEAEKHAKPFTDYLARRYNYFIDTFGITGTKIIFPNFDDGPDADVGYDTFFFTINCAPDADIKACARVVQSSSTFGKDDNPVVVVIPCETNGKWRSLYFHFDYTVKEKTQLLLLNLRDDTHVDLTIERGEHAGEYISFHFDPQTEQYTEVVS